jgi:hypothetical protein
MDNETLTTEAVMDTYQHLPAHERRQWDELADGFRIGYHVRTGSKNGLGEASSIELVGKLGIFLAKSDYVIRT